MSICKCKPHWRHFGFNCFGEVKCETCQKPLNINWEKRRSKCKIHVYINEIQDDGFTTIKKCAFCNSEKPKTKKDMSTTHKLLEKVDSLYGKVESYKREFVNKLSTIPIELDEIKKDIKNLEEAPIYGPSPIIEILNKIHQEYIKQASEKLDNQILFKDYEEHLKQLSDLWNVPFECFKKNMDVLLIHKREEERKLTQQELELLGPDIHNKLIEFFKQLKKDKGSLTSVNISFGSRDINYEDGGFYEQILAKNSFTVKITGYK